ncbi:methyl-accepting chemotaxis protein [Comamonas aquatica]|uniref:methyl-accepting chemotaxis protein n=1 Tax=Comamonas aquatica TaxID=225991 RepID=UPI00244AA010|nr:methyl-accepting chemotaxis protein [Comamonas aquatica]MDH1380872.1 methyl-accepting chemotaxis protein [Comamonas aquatica]MDH1640949.1 methyl-accepting chemotaxis protein [Comamonas aquatica]
MSHTNIQQALQEIGRQADVLMLLLIMGCSILAVPIAWHYSSLDGVLIFSPLLSALAAALCFSLRGTVITRYALPLLLCATVALHIQVSLGTIEFHFGVFVTLALVMVYREWRVVLACAAFFAVHHILFDRLQAWGYGIYCTTEADFQKIVLHATFVVAQTAVEIFILQKMVASYRQGIELQGLVNALDDGGQFNLDISGESVQTPLARELQALMLNLHDTVRTVTHSVRQMQTASHEIQTGSNDLSARTEMACNALEETASAASRVLAAGEHARALAADTDAMTRNATEAAHQGQAVVAALAQSMATIRQQSQEIAEIVAVVDGLAFQTNLLALNAAVEAARAGEQGRGFAVVAEEVRRLALRSADAAQQIRGLIQSSGQAIALGSSQSQDALAAMQQLQQASGNVTGSMREIMDSTQEQASAMADITQAIHQLEHSMSQNSALAEESHAAASSLQEQTVQMRRSVQAFKI